MRTALSLIATSLFAAGLSSAPVRAAEAPRLAVQAPRISLPESCKTAATGADQFECSNALNRQWYGLVVGQLGNFSFMSDPGVTLPAECDEIDKLAEKIDEKNKSLRMDATARIDYADLLRKLTHAEAACTNALADTVKDPKEPVNLLRQAAAKLNAMADGIYMPKH